MDALRFDALARALSAAGSRRGLLGILAGFPLAGGLVAFLADEDADAKGQRKRHKKPHHHRKHTGNRAGKHKKRQKKKCKPHSTAKTCAGICGQVKNNCKKIVDCGSCACDPPCPVCQSCEETTGACVANADLVGEACDPCHTCDAAGECAAVADGTACDDDDACTQVDTCQGGVCVGGDPVVCQPLDLCYDAGICDPETGQCSNPEKNGAACDDGNACTHTDTCQSGVCVGSAVVCNACQLPDSCDPDTGQCAPDPAKRHTCDGPCPSGKWCDAGACAAIQATLTVVECGSRCSEGTDIATTTICGQSVTCPNCSPNCEPQTGCSSRSFLPDGPAGASWYCSTATGEDCTTTSDCPSDRYCGHTECTRICPF